MGLGDLLLRRGSRLLLPIFLLVLPMRGGCAGGRSGIGSPLAVDRQGEQAEREQEKGDRQARPLHDKPPGKSRAKIVLAATLQEDCRAGEPRNPQNRSSIGNTLGSMRVELDILS